VLLCSVRERGATGCDRVPHKGANTLKEKLETQDRTSAALQARFNELALASLSFDILPNPD
jgi:hypothetical protein